MKDMILMSCTQSCKDLRNNACIPQYMAISNSCQYEFLFTWIRT